MAFYNEYENKFHKNFKILISSENSEIFSPKFLHNSFKISSGKLNSFKQNFFNSKEILQINERHNSKMSDFALFHSILLERMNFPQLGFISEQEFSDFELKCILDLTNVFSVKQCSNFLNETVLNTLYLANSNNKNDQRIIRTIFERVFSRKTCQNNLNIEEKETKEELSYSQDISGLQYNAEIESNKYKIVKIIHKIECINKSTGFLKNKSFEHEKKHLILEKISQFWANLESKLRLINTTELINPILKSYIESEVRIYSSLIQIINEMVVSINMYLNGKIKMLDVISSKDITSAETPFSLLTIWDNNKNIFKYFDSLLELKNSLKNNIESFSINNFEINLKGIIGYKKFFEVMRLISFKTENDTNDFTILNICNKKDALLTLKGIYLQGGILNENGKIEKVSNEERFVTNQFIEDLPLNFISKKNLTENKILGIQVFNNSKRSMLVCEIFSEIETVMTDFFLLSSLGFYALEND